MTQRYNLNEFPELHNFLKCNYNISKVNACDTYQVNDEGKLCKMTDDFMFISYDTWEYNADNPNAFYEDFNRSASEQPSSHLGKQDDDFKQFAFAVRRKIKPKIVKKHEAKCMKFLKIIYDYPKRLSVPVAAMCVNQMFSTKLKTTMHKYDNKSKTKLILQKLREQFSLLH